MLISSVPEGVTTRLRRGCMEENEDPRIAKKWVFGVPPRPGPYFYGPNWHTSHVMGVVFYVKQYQQQQQQQQQEQQEQEQEQEQEHEQEQEQ